MLEKLVKRMIELWHKRYEMELKGEDTFLINVDIANVEYMTKKEIGI